MAAMGLALIPQGAMTAAPMMASGVFHRPVTGRTMHNDQQESTTWSGYAVSAASAFTEATGGWTQPIATCKSTGRTYAAFWVGIDGYSSNSVEQLGTDSDCTSRTHPSYYAWWEMYPAGSVSLSTSTYPVRAGDTLTATVKRSGASYALSLKSSEGWTFATTQSASNANSSAEWVAESPELCSYFACSNARLTNFGAVTFANSEAAAGAALEPVSSFTASGGPHQITMISSTGTTVRAQPSGLAAGGKGFSDAWHHA
jgi:hypothetical protein